MTQPLDSALPRRGLGALWRAPVARPAAGSPPEVRASAVDVAPAGAADPRFVRVVREGDALVQDGAASAALGPVGADTIGWARWQWDGCAVTAETCRYGIRPLYYHVAPDRILIAPSIATLLALGAPAELDAAALAVFLRFENFVGEDTPFKHIRALPPAARLEWSGTLRLSGGFWRPPRLALNRTQALDAYTRLFRAAVERLVALPGVVPLSGGCDSRHIAFELARLGALAECVSVRSLPPRSDDDVRIAARVADTIAARHVVLEQDQDRFAATVRATVETSYCGKEHVWFRPLAGHLAHGAAGPPVLDGLGGDVLSAGLFLEAKALELFRRGRLTQLARHYLRGHVGPLPFLADPDDASAGLAAARLVRELVRHQGAANPVGSFFFWNRTRRVVALQFLALLPHHTVLTPYLDPAVFDLLAGLPAEMFLDHRFHREALHRAFPQFAALEFSGARRRDPRNLRAGSPQPHFRRYGRAILGRLDSHPSRLINRRYARPRIRYLAWTGSPAACWTADACLYLSQLEYAGQATAAEAPAV
jgi:hypothetical protein